MNISDNFTDKFAKLLGQGINAYATTYGVGVFLAIGFRTHIEQNKRDIENLLNSIGIKFTTEYSGAGWVFRYKISKSVENLAVIESFIKNQ